MSYHATEIAKVPAAPVAEALIGRLRDRHGPVLFPQSGGGCDGFSPMCFPQDDFIVGAPLYMNPQQ